MNTDKTETWSSSNILDTSLGAGRDYFFVKKNSANRSITSALLVAIVCFGRGRWARGFVEIKIFDQNLTLLKMI